MTDMAPYNNFPYNCKPDCSVYDCRSSHKEGLNSALLNFFIEFKTKPHHNPFLQQEDRKATDLNPLINTTAAARKVAGQIISCATLVLGTQYCTHVFSVLIIKNLVRLIRWDRSGAIVTEPIKYNKDLSFVDFLIRYDNASKAMCGHDPTIDFPSEEDVWAAQVLDDLADTKSLLLITIKDSNSSNLRRYIVSTPRARPSIPAGCWTQTSIMYNIKTGDRVLVKDSWQLLLDGIQAEGVVYATLEHHSVPSIPCCLLSGDVGKDNYHRSQTDRFTEKFWNHPHPLTVTPHWHYHLVLGTIGKTFMNSAVAGSWYRQ